MLLLVFHLLSRDFHKNFPPKHTIISGYYLSALYILVINIIVLIRTRSVFVFEGATVNVCSCFSDVSRVISKFLPKLIPLSASGRALRRLSILFINILQRLDGNFFPVTV